MLRSSVEVIDGGVGLELEINLKGNVNLILEGCVCSVYSLAPNQVGFQHAMLKLSRDAKHHNVCSVTCKFVRLMANVSFLQQLLVNFPV